MVLTDFMVSVSDHGDCKHQKDFPCSVPSSNALDSLSLIKLNYSSRDEDTGKITSAVFPDTTPSFITDLVFNDRDDLINWCQEMGFSMGAVIVTKRSDTLESGRKPRLLLACERSGNYNPKVKVDKSFPISEKKVWRKHARKTTSKKCGCLFMLKGVISSEGKWSLSVVCGSHNHPLGKNLIGHAYAGRLKPAEKMIVRDLSKGGVQPREMLTVIKERDPKNVSTRSTIYNFRAKNRLVELEGRSQMQQLLKDLNDNHFTKFHKEDSGTGECTDIFFAHPNSIIMAQCFPEVVIMDCTYNTNTFNLPLFEVVGFTSTMKTFSIAFAFLQFENEDSYIWALHCLHDLFQSRVSSVGVLVTDRDLELMNAIPKVFPDVTHLLCRFHVTKNVEKECKKFFAKKDEVDKFMGVFEDLIRSGSEVEYINNWRKLNDGYVKYKHLLHYIEKEWLSKYKERFVLVWTNSVMHFGTQTTNRAESMHASLKRHLGTRRGNFVRNWKVINNLIQNQLTDILGSFNMSINRVAKEFRTDVYSEVRGFISGVALEMLSKELKRSTFIGGNKEKCGCVARRTCGIPYAHELSEITSHCEGCIPLSLINARWRKLDDVPLDLPLGSLDILPEIEVIKKKFYSESDHQKVLMIKRCAEIGDPKRTFMQEPQVKVNKRGRPSSSQKRPVAAKDKNETRREPSDFEYAETIEEKLESQKTKRNIPKRKGKLQVKRKGKGCGTTSILDDLPELETARWEDGLSELNPLVRDFIDAWEDVPGDGHCGYRSIAGMIGLENDWKLVRQCMLDELMEHADEYANYLGNNIVRFEEIKANLQCTSDSTMDPKEWFTVPDMGCLVASTFNCVFVCISARQSFTYFPLWTAPTQEKSRVVSIANIQNGMHFAKILLSSDAPLPPIVPDWNANASQVAKSWKALFQDKIALWPQLTYARNIMNLGKLRTERKLISGISNTLRSSYCS